MKPFHKLLAGCALATSLASCQTGFELNSEGEDQRSETSGTFIGPGDEADWVLSIFDDDTFELEKRDRLGIEQFTASGRIDEEDSGFFSLDVTDDDDDLANNITGEVAFFRASDNLLFVTPIETGDRDIVIMIAEDDCPGPTLNGNFVAADLSAANLNNPNDIVVGTFEYNVGDAEVDLVDVFSVEEGDDDDERDFIEVPDDTASAATTFTVTGDCDEREGIINANEQNMYVSDDNAIFYTGENRYLLLDESSPNALSDIDGEYIGLMVNGANEEPEEVFVVCGGEEEAGVCIISEREFDTTDIDDTDEVFRLILTDVNDPTGGFIQGSVTTSGSDANGDFGSIACNYNDPSSSVFLACTGQSPQANQEQFLLYIVTD